ncbi:MAG: sigma-70 family RNA polymerase sigma factor [Verrucomicrobiota bacterium]
MSSFERSARSRLATFAKTGDETAFRELVDEYAGIVFQGALQRTGDRDLAEEVMQKVFTSLAVKASKVASHPSLSGWLFTATRLEAAKTMRTQRRYRRKVQAFGREITETQPDISPPDWKETLPDLNTSLDHLGRTDRQLILARYFSGLSFGEMAEASGLSEAACKMRVRRALAKLQSWFHRRGITISTAAVASALAAELTKAPPAALISSVASTALTAASTPGLSLVPSILIMNLPKPIVTASTVLALTSLPLVMQNREARAIQSRIQQLKATERPLDFPTLVEAPPAGEGFASTPVGQFMANLENDVPDAEALIHELADSMRTNNLTRIIRVTLPLGHLEPAEYKKLIDEVAASPQPESLKAPALHILTELEPSDNSEQKLDRLIQADLDPANASYVFSKWAKEDFEAARAWFEKRKAAGDLIGKGLNRSPQDVLQTELALAAANGQPDVALKLARDLETGIHPGQRDAALARLVASFAMQGERGLDPALEIILGAGDDPPQQVALASSAVRYLRRSAPEAVETFQKRLPAPVQLQQAAHDLELQEQAEKAKAAYRDAIKTSPHPIQP